jgi:futalosine hydrolase
MFILLAAATTFEIQPTIDRLAGPAAGHPVTELNLGPHRVAPLITGVGSISTTWSLMRQIDRDRPDVIIQAGIAGCFGQRPAGEVLAVGEDSLADLGVWEEGRFRTLFDLNLADGETTPFSGGRLVNPYKQLITLTALESVSAITVNEITTDAGRIRWYQQNSPAVVESMEGGALHYVCLREQVPFLQLRSISNEIGVRDKTKWDIRSAIANLNRQLINLLEKLARETTTVLES